MYIIQPKLFRLLPIKNKTNSNKHATCQLCSMQLQKEVRSNPKQPSCKKCAAPKNDVLIKGIKIQSGSQEMAVM